LRLYTKAAGALAAVPSPVEAQPDGIGGAMREYQLEGVSWLVSMYDRAAPAILADEMGLGKTLQTIAFFRALKNLRDIPGPHLVVCPLSVLSSWMLEATKWCPEMRFTRLHTSDVDERAR